MMKWMLEWTIEWMKWIEIHAGDLNGVSQHLCKINVQSEQFQTVFE